MKMNVRMHRKDSGAPDAATVHCKDLGGALHAAEVHCKDLELIQGRMGSSTEGRCCVMGSSTEGRCCVITIQASSFHFCLTN